MFARAMNARALLIAAAVTTVVLVGAGVAYATGSSGDSSAQQATGGADLEKAKSVALEHVNGRVTETEIGDEEGYYQIEVTRDDGSQVDVNLDRNFNVLSTPADNEDSNGSSSDGQDASGDSGG